MKDSNNKIVAACLIILVMNLVNHVFSHIEGFRSGSDCIKDQAIENNHAYWHPKTGDFTWVIEEKK